MSNYDVVVLGAGPGGYVCAIRAAQLGLKAAVVEKQWMGGVCLNVGCIPTKSLLKNAEVVHTIRERSKEFGISCDNLQIDYAAAVKRSRKVSQRLTKGVSFLMNKNKVDVYNGVGRLQGRDTIVVKADDGTEQTLKASNIVIATGARPSPIPGMEPDGKKVLTYLDAILQESLPQSAVVIGAGALGLEFATVWNSYGSEITLVEMMPHLAPTEDEEVSIELEKEFKKAGITGLAGHRVLGIDHTDQGVAVRVQSGDEVKTIEAEQALIAIGFKPNSSDIGLEEAGVTLKKGGFVEIDRRMATNVTGIWSIGDVTGELMLAHVASTQGMIVAENIAGESKEIFDYRMMPRAIYSHPQVASFGLTEQQAIDEGYEVKVGRFPFQGIGKAIALGDYPGFVKVVSDAKYGEILGAHMIGPDVSELLPEYTLAHRNELTAAEIGANVHAHPTLSEILMEAAHAVDGHAIHM
jgi:dihydrolipoamide dehydrogenase